ncbi:MAG: nucleoside deaminase [Phycisphaerae bacterium]|nr:nucleoside deaminase [Phycisphaerae bacterium]
MRRALELADRASSLGEVPVGAVVYRTGGGAVLGEGFNRREIDKDPAAHAEFTAILGACGAIGDWRLNECSLAVTLEPCPMCAGLIVNARVGRVLYGADDPKAGACRSLFAIASDARLNHRAEVVAGVLAEESSARLRAFFRALRAKGD